MEGGKNPLFGWFFRASPPMFSMWPRTGNLEWGSSGKGKEPIVWVII
jgi:hypothetical protein